MNFTDAEEKQEIIIVRRGGNDDHDDHHGGAWKIAFADFMTAMMCFFLVMWLINAANEQTRAAVASYFNPVKLVDRNTNRKGLEDVGEGPQEARTDENDLKKETNKKAGAKNDLSGPSQNEDGTDISEQPKHSDENFFSNPYAVLADIASETGQLQNVSAKGEGGAADAGPATGASGGESYRDPFAPDFWSTQTDDGKEMQPNRGSASATSPEKSVEEQLEAYLNRDEPGEQEHAAEAQDNATQDAVKQDKTELQAARIQDTAAKPAADKADAASQTAALQTANEQSGNEQTGIEQMAKNATEAAEIKTELEQSFDNASIPQGVTVTPTERGVLISIADAAQDGMFEIGSAVPRAGMVHAMEKIGRTLAERPGNVMISGHTDARPFAGEHYDNWRLSTARAHSAYYMLVRGGLAENRVVEVAGFADRRLKVPEDPLADANRRIEVLLETGN